MPEGRHQFHAASPGTYLSRCDEIAGCLIRKWLAPGTFTKSIFSLKKTPVASMKNSVSNPQAERESRALPPHPARTVYILHPKRSRGKSLTIVQIVISVYNGRVPETTRFIGFSRFARGTVSPLIHTGISIEVIRSQASSNHAALRN